MLGVLIAGLLKSVNLEESGAEPPRPEDIATVNEPRQLRYQVEVQQTEHGVKSGSMNDAMNAAAVMLNVSECYLVNVQQPQ